MYMYIAIIIYDTDSMKPYTYMIDNEFKLLTNEGLFNN